MAVDHEKIRRILGDKEEATDHGLGAKSLDRALSGDVPKTLTPYEWEQWYADNGVPDSHIAPEAETHKELFSDTTARSTTWLGRAGSLPFIGFLLAFYLQPQHQSLWTNALATYTLTIICFLVGAWWGLALVRRNAVVLVLSNIIVLMAFFGHLLLTAGQFLPLGAFLLFVTLAAERRHPLFKAQPRYYTRLRLQLTLVASMSLLITTLLL